MLGALEDSKLNMSQQCILVAEIMNSTHGSVNGSIGSRSRKVMIALYLAPIRPHLDIAPSFGTPTTVSVLGIFQDATG